MLGSRFGVLRAMYDTGEAVEVYDRAQQWLGRPNGASNEGGDSLTAAVGVAVCALHTRVLPTGADVLAVADGSVRPHKCVRASQTV